MRVGTILTKDISDKIITNAVCPKCHNHFDAHMHRIVQSATLFFIPISKATLSCYTTCPNCKQQYKLSKKTYKTINNTLYPSDMLYQQCSNYLLSKHYENEKYTERSNKKVSIAFLLSFFLGVVGVQNWYLGHKRRALFTLVLDLICLVIFLVLGIVNLSLQIKLVFVSILSCFIAFNIYWGIFYSLMIIFGHSRDSVGRYLMTDKQYKKHRK